MPGQELWLEMARAMRGPGDKPRRWCGPGVHSHSLGQLVRTPGPGSWSCHVVKEEGEGNEWCSSQFPSCLADVLRLGSKWMSFPCSVEASKHSFLTMPRVGEPAHEPFSDTPFCTCAGGFAVPCFHPAFSFVVSCSVSPQSLKIGSVCGYKSDVFLREMSQGRTDLTLDWRPVFIHSFTMSLSEQAML